MQVVKLSVVYFSGILAQRVMHRSLSKDNLTGASAMPGAMATAALRVMPGAMTKDNVKVHEPEPTYPLRDYLFNEALSAGRHLSQISL